ncbi:RNA polymerase sigma factor [Conexibacter woesei]|uniref:RNA polymerase, sigma-24 subunit, ECF subfamily n=1 Tax=Conexibacter woesei (strain DSM 14684 / CCUG 47730 / CIP 108061 / JCM 11494 / NBRC 100937 / ID131577) TaxID=469383 RepID=D3F764_CONWI|nr:RNA polymerase sigma factor [Conexibacter woesei]ADB48835.1 RNA polymerase, sigma-24 subunit, ECF subfamily [Conexibacter woesei DSM 14684]
MRRLEPQAVVRHLDRLYRSAWALCGSREDAEDLVQETVARVLARPRRLHGEEELAYLLSALRNTFLTTRRTASRRPQEVAQLDDVVAGDPRAETRPEAALEAHELFDAIARLPEDFRLALVAVDVAGLSYREAAKALRTREATITSRLHRARERVTRDLAGERSGSSRSLR